MKKNFMIKLDFFILAFILLLALLFRLYKIDQPLADFHSWRQADTAAVARNFIKDGFDLFHPRYDDLSSIETGKENPQGYRMVEFPFYNALFAYVYKIFPVAPMETVGRLTTVFFSLIIIGVIYYLSLKESQRTTAVFAGISYAVLPFFVYFSRVILPETPALGLMFLSIFFLHLFSQTKNKLLEISALLLSIVFSALAILTKPTAIFYLLTGIYLFYRKYSFSFIKRIYCYIFFAFSVIPFIAWRQFITHYPEGVPASDWLITSVNTYQGLQRIFFRPAFFRWIFFERLNNLILGGYLTVFFILGIISKQKKLFLHSLLLSSIVYLFIFQGGNVQHEYYQTMILPAIAISIGLGISFLTNNLKSFISPLIVYLTIAVIFGLSFFFSFYKVRDYYHYPTDLIQIAKIVSALTTKKDKIVTDRTGDTTLLYLMDRQGAPAIYKDPDVLKKLGYQYLVTQNLEYVNSLKEKHQVVFENNNFALIKL